MKHANIAIFVPHLGCPHMCAFCNQKHITGCSVQPSKSDVVSAVETALSSGQAPQNCEIAFFGGSFTAIDRKYMLELLSAASECVKKYGFKGIRVSTRPDCIDGEILDILKSEHVTAIELGAQSMDDEVLARNERGHTAKQVRDASALIKSYGFELGLQMMTGLYGSSREADIFTANELAGLRPDTVRIYPAVTLKNTRLEELYLSGDYEPSDLETAVSLCTEICGIFDEAEIKVIRLGLHTIDQDSYVAGPWHPAFRELCDSLRFRNILDGKVSDGIDYVVKVNPADISKLVGQKRSNLEYFINRNIALNIVQDKTIAKNTVFIEEVK